MNSMPQQRLDRRVHESMALELCATLKGRRDDAHPEVTALTCAGVPCVLRAVIGNLQTERSERALQRFAQPGKLQL